MKTRTYHFKKVTVLLVTCFVVCGVVSMVWAQEQSREKKVHQARVFDQLDATAREFDEAFATNYRWLSDIRQTDESSSAVLGVHVRSVDATLGYHLELADGIGLVVEMVTPESAAAECGVQLHDVLKKVNDQLLINAEQLRTLINMKNPGDQVSLEVLRGHQTITLTATLKEGPAESSAELFHMDKMDFDVLAQVHDLSNPEIQNCSNCHVINGDTRYHRN